MNIHTIQYRIEYTFFFFLTILINGGLRISAKAKLAEFRSITILRLRNEKFPTRIRHFNQIDCETLKV